MPSIGPWSTMNILSFDIEEWFHLLEVEGCRTLADWSRLETRIHGSMELIFDLLTQTNTRATFFCLGWIAERYPEVIQSIQARGYEIGSHSFGHGLIHQASQEGFRQDLRHSIEAIGKITGSDVKLFRAPGFSLTNETPWVFQELLDHGIDTDCSVFPASRSHGGYLNFGTSYPCRVQVGSSYIKEFPINPIKLGPLSLVYSGGGYYRILPLTVLQFLFKQNPYNMAYFHPRDFDFEQPILSNLSLARRFKSYNGLKHTKAKLMQTLRAFPFTDVATASATIDWENTPIIKLRSQSSIVPKGTLVYEA